MFTASGLLVRFLKVFEKSNYQSVKVSKKHRPSNCPKIEANLSFSTFFLVGSM